MNASEDEGMVYTRPPMAGGCHNVFISERAPYDELTDINIGHIQKVIDKRGFVLKN
jgi:hypothetical protein